MFDSNAPGAERITAPTWDQVSNGVLSVSVTINDRSANIAGPNGYLQTWNAGDGNLGHTEFDAFARNVNADGNSDFVSFAFPSLALPTSLASSFSSVTGYSGSDGELGFNSNGGSYKFIRI